jgi:hypothetical protein
MIIQLDKSISECSADESVRVILRQIVSALNALHDGKNQSSTDVIFRDANSGPVGIGTDGNYYRGVIKTEGETVSWDFIRLGKERPK